jgi:hypothetical protein
LKEGDELENGLPATGEGQAGDKLPPR